MLTEQITLGGDRINFKQGRPFPVIPVTCQG